MEGTGISGIGRLGFFDDYFKGAGYGSGGADNFTFKAPVTRFRLDNLYNIIN